jgi:hypothetical protein
LRDADDLYGPRIISLDQSYQANPYTLASGLADQKRWPELNIPNSPNLSETEAETTLLHCNNEYRVAKENCLQPDEKFQNNEIE